MMKPTPNLDRATPGSGGRYFGVYTGTVKDNQDPQGQGRVAVTVAALEGKPAREPVWARVAVAFAGNERGMWMLPDVGDEVLVAFEAGDPGRPIVVGGLWGGDDRAPETMDPQNSRKSIVTRSGLRVTLRDDHVSIEIRTPEGQSLVLSDDTHAVVIRDTSGSLIRLAPDGVSVSSPIRVQVSAATLEISGGLIALNGGMVRATGTVQCDTLIANSVVANSYTPGAGNLW